MKKLLLVLLLISHSVFPQSGGLDQVLNLEVRDTPLQEVLKQIEGQTGLLFSYNSNLIQTSKRITYTSRGNTLETVMFDLLGPEIKARVRGKYIILQPKNSQKKDFYVFGYVRDADTGEQIENVSIYESVSFASALSNTHGYYKIKLPRSQRDIDLHFSKEEYDFRIATIYGRNDQKLDVSLRPEVAERVLTEEVAFITTKGIPPGISTSEELKKTLETSKPVGVPVVEADPAPKLNIPRVELRDELAFLDSTVKRGKDQFMQWLMTTRQNKHAQNIHDSLYRPFQISFLPFLGTNLSLSPLVTNDYSVNVVAGYTGNVNKLEVGSVANIVRGTMNGVQLSGAINVVGKQQKGLQMAGASNFNFGNSDGVVLAGASNFILGDARGFAAAGAINATFGTHEGLQIAPFNYAGRIVGSQIGIVNVAEESTGVPVGLLSFVKRNGYRRLEINTSELNVGELSFKTGVPAFYTLLGVNYSFNQVNKPLFGFGYGLGTSWKYNRWLGSDLDLTSYTYLPDRTLNYDIENWSQQFRLSLGLEVKLGRLAFFAAPTANLFFAESGSLNFSNYPLLISDRELNWFGSGGRYYTWIGYKAGIRLCNKS